MKTTNNNAPHDKSNDSQPLPPLANNSLGDPPHEAINKGVTNSTPGILNAESAGTISQQGQTSPSPLPHQSTQMLLGTLLGDGVMDWNPRFGRYCIRHGSKQKEYCESKAALLAKYITTPPKIVPNKGWGKESCVFATVTSPDFEFLRELCYVKKPGTRDDERKYVRRINPDWLGLLDWEAIAWW